MGCDGQGGCGCGSGGDSGGGCCCGGSGHHSKGKSAKKCADCGKSPCEC